ncbi:MAG: TetR/AcrR family transcriptional regulator [Desulfovibrionaceae bacterium]
MTERMESPLRREQIADAALTLVVEQGLGAVTVRRVAEAVGISAAALYRHYKNKADILQAVLEEHQEMHLANIRKAKAVSPSPLEALHWLYNSVMKLVMRYRALPVIFLSDILWFEEPRLKELKMAHHRIMRESLVELLTKGQAMGEIRSDIRPQELFVHYLGLIAMPALMSARGPDEVDMNRQTKANWEMFAAAVRP